MTGIKLALSITSITCGIFFGNLIGYHATHYNRSATISEVNEGVVHAVDKSGHEWGFEGTRYKVGQEVVLRMHTKGTDNIIRDDEVIDAKEKR